MWSRGQEYHLHVSECEPESKYSKCLVLGSQARSVTELERQPRFLNSRLRALPWAVIRADKGSCVQAMAFPWGRDLEWGTYPWRLSELPGSRHIGRNSVGRSRVGTVFSPSLPHWLSTGLMALKMKFSVWWDRKDSGAASPRSPNVGLDVSQLGFRSHHGALLLCYQGLACYSWRLWGNCEAENTLLLSLCYFSSAWTRCVPCRSTIQRQAAGFQWLGWHRHLSAFAYCSCSSFLPRSACWTPFMRTSHSKCCPFSSSQYPCALHGVGSPPFCSKAQCPGWDSYTSTPVAVCRCILVYADLEFLQKHSDITANFKNIKEQLRGKVSFQIIWLCLTTIMSL